MPTIALDPAIDLPGSDQLRRQRAEAAGALGAATPPSAEDEIWRYSRIAEFDLSRWTPRLAAPTLSGPTHLVSGDDVPDRPASDPFVDHLNGAFMSPLVVRVPAGRAVAEPLVIEHHVADTGTAIFPRLVIEAGADSEITVIERFVGPDGVDALVCPVLDVVAAQAARVRYLGINELGRSTWLLGHQRAEAQRDSSLLLATVALGGDYARMRTDAAAVGQGASVRQIALYFADGTQMHDFRTIQRHDAPKSSSDLLFKGAVHDTARSVYTGLIRIGHDAGGTSAFQTNRNLTLSTGAWAESVPNLEIETNDVRCSHASTVGPVDEEQRFYLESRGIRPEVAERLIVLGFFDDVLGQLPVTPELATALRARVAAKLERTRS